MQTFDEVLFFQATYNIKTGKQTIQLILCQLDVGGWQKEKDIVIKYSLGRRNTTRVKHLREGCTTCVPCLGRLVKSVAVVRLRFIQALIYAI